METVHWQSRPIGRFCNDACASAMSSHLRRRKATGQPRLGKRRKKEKCKKYIYLKNNNNGGENNFRACLDGPFLAFSHLTE